VALKLAQDLMNGPGRLDPTPNGALAPARQNTSADPCGPPLSDEDVVCILKDYLLPVDRVLLFSDFIKAGLFTEYCHLSRAIALGFPSGVYHTAKRRIWVPRAVAAYLSNLPNTPPAVLTELRVKGGRRRAAIAAARKLEAAASGA
jgi:hypothetical protein